MQLWASHSNFLLGTKENIFFFFSEQMDGHLFFKLLIWLCGWTVNKIWYMKINEACGQAVERAKLLISVAGCSYTRSSVMSDCNLRTSSIKFCSDLYLVQSHPSRCSIGMNPCGLKWWYKVDYYPLDSECYLPSTQISTSENAKFC